MKNLTIIIGVILVMLFVSGQNAFGTYYYGGAGDGFDVGESATPVKLQLLLPGETASPGGAPGKIGTPTARTTGISFNVTVNSVDANWNIDAVSTTVRITTSDPYDTEPADDILIAGSTIFLVSFNTAGPQIITATDMVMGLTTDSTTVSVFANAPAKLQLLVPGETAAAGSTTGKVGAPGIQTVGTMLTVTINSVDANWNIVNSSPTVQINTSDPYDSEPGWSFLMSGTWNFNVNLQTAGTTSITASDLSTVLISNVSPSITVNPGTAMNLLLLLPGETAAPGKLSFPYGKIGTPSNRTVGSAFNVTVNCVDNWYNLVPGAVQPQVAISTSDPSDTEPLAAYLISSAGTFSVNLQTSGYIMITAADTYLAGTSYSMNTTGVTATSTPPTVSSIDPATGQNTSNRSATITGTGFNAGASVKLIKSGQSDVGASIVSWLSATSLYAELPIIDRSIGPWDVTVINPDYGTGTLTSGYTITATAPTVASVTPSATSNIGTVTIYVYGTNFYAGLSTKLAKGGESDINGTVVSVFSSTCFGAAFNVDGIVGGNWDVKVTNTDTQTCTGSSVISLNAIVSTPTVNPASGTYTGAVTITLATSTSGATIRYTTDGSAPYSESPIYSDPFTQSSSATIRAYAMKGGYLDSGEMWMFATIQAYTPVITPAAGTYSGSVTITMATGTSGATIKYTTDGSNPNAGSADYTGPFTWSTSSTIKAFAIKFGVQDSAVTAPTIFSVTALPPTVSSINPASGLNNSGKSVTISGANFMSWPTVTLARAGQTEISATSVSTLSSASVQAEFPITGRVIGAWDVRVMNTDTQAATLTSGFTITSAAPTVITVTPSAFSNSGTVTLNISGVDFYPGLTTKLTKSGESDITGTIVSLYSSSFFTGSYNVDNKAGGFWDMKVTNIDAQTGTGGSMLSLIATAATPSITPGTGTYTGSVTVTMTTATTGATIKYTTDGSAPYSGSATYSAPFTQTSSATIRAIATKDGYINSSEAVAASVTIQAFTPLITPAPSTYTGSVTITLETGTAGATIRYTTDGSNPTVGSTMYATPFTQTASATIKAFAYKTGLQDSTVATNIYSIISKLQLLVPGETAAPGGAPGKTGSPTARTTGVSFNITVNSVDANWNVLAASSTVKITTSDLYDTEPSDGVLIGGTNIYLVSFRTSGAQKITATDMNLGLSPDVSPNITVNANTPAKLQLLVPGETVAAGSTTGKSGMPTSRIAGVAFNVTVNAVDAAWNQTNSSPTVGITTNDPYATNPGLNALIAGSRSFSVTLQKGGTTSITASDLSTVLVSNVSPAITVNPNTAVRLQLLLPGETAAAGKLTGTAGKTGTPIARTAGTPFNVTVNCTDDWYNIVTSANTEVTLTTSDSYDTSISPFNTISGTAASAVTLQTAAAGHTITATDTGGFGYNNSISPAFTVNPNTATKLQLLVPGETAAAGKLTGPAGKSGTPNTAVAGTAFNTTVNCTDDWYNLVPGAVQPAVAVTTNDLYASEPAEALLVSSTKLFSVTLKTAGASTISATDTNGAGTTYTQNVSPSITVGTGAAVKLQLLAPGETAVPGSGTGKTGTPSNMATGGNYLVTVNGVDANWNKVTSSSAQVTITTSDIFDIERSGFLSSGTRALTVSPITAGALVITASDMAFVYTQCASPSITVNQGAPSVTSVSPSAGVNSGSLSVTINGTNFVSGLTAKLVKAGQGDINGTSVTALSSTLTRAIFNLAAQVAGGWDVTVTNPDAQTSTLTTGFTITTLPAPTVSTVGPSSSVNVGTKTLSITGTNFVAGITAKLAKAGFTDISGTNVTALSSTLVRAAFLLADQGPGNWDVSVTNPDTQSATLTGGLTITAASPSVSWVDPVTSVNVGSKTLSISGTNFYAGASAKLVKSGQSDINGTGVTVLSSSLLRGVFDLDGKAVGLWDAKVTNTDAQIGTGNSLYTLTGTVETPVIAPAAGTYTNSVNITITTGTAGATIRYTTDGSAPNGSSTEYFGAFSRTATAPIKAFAQKGGYYADSSAATTEITIQASAPSISPASGTYTGSVTITMTTSTSGATIKYTTDGSTPNGSSANYTTAFTQSTTATVKSFALKGGISDSNVSTGIFTVQAGIPRVTGVSPSSGSNLATSTITLTGSYFFGATGSDNVSFVRFDDAGNTALDISGAVITDPIISGAVVPAGITAGLYNVKVTTSGGTNVTSTQKFTVTTPVPVVDSVTRLGGSTLNTSPATLSINGSGFFGGLATSNVTNIELDTLPSRTAASSGITALNDSAISDVIFPSGITPGIYNVIVTTNGGSNVTSSTKLTLTSVAPAPTVSGINPSTGSNLTPTVVTITGTNFFAGEGSSSVNNVYLDDPANTMLSLGVASITDTVINTAVVSNGVRPGTYNIKVTTTAGTNVTSVQKFTVTTPPPTVTNVYRFGGITVNTAPVTLSITGTGFFGGLAVSDILDIELDTWPTHTSALTTSISAGTDNLVYSAVFTSGISIGVYNVMVTTHGGTNSTSTVKLTLTNAPPPTVTSVSPSTGSNSGVTFITIDGTNFYGGTGANTVTSVNLDDSGNTAVILGLASYTDTTINSAIITNGIKAGAYNVKVTTLGGTNSTSSQKFTVTTALPVVNTVSVLGGGSATNTAPFTLAITGSGFFGGTVSADVLDIQLDTSPTYTSAVTNSISVATDSVISGASFPLVVTPGTYNVIVVNSGGTNVTSVQKLTINAVSGFDAGELLVDNNAVTNTSVTATDSSGTKIVIPPGALDKDVKLLVTKDNTVADGIAYMFRMRDSATDAILTNLLKPVTITLAYTVTGGVVGNTGITEAQANTKLAIYFYDGVSWRKLASAINPFDRTLTAQTSKTGLYAIKAIQSYGDRVLYSPNPFTPNGDGINDSVSFYFDNENNEPTVIKIMTRKGDVIKTLTNELSWDGTTDSGAPAVAGLYYWQVGINGSMKKRGSVTLAR